MSKIDPIACGLEEDESNFKSCIDMYYYNKGKFSKVNTEFLIASPSVKDKYKAKDLVSSLCYGDKINSSNYSRYVANFDLFKKGKTQVLAAYGQVFNQLAKRGCKFKSDFSAKTEFLFNVISGRFKMANNITNSKFNDNCEKVSKIITNLNFSASKMGSKFKDSFKESVVSECNYSKSYWDARTILEILSRLNHERVFTVNKAGHARLRKGVHKNEIDGFIVKNNYYIKRLKRFTFYSTGKFIIIKYCELDYAYVFGKKAMNCLEDRLLWYVNMTDYLVNYDIMKLGAAKRLTEDFNTIINWMIIQKDYSLIAKHMKTSLAIIQNDFRSEDEQLETHWKARSNNLKIECLRSGIIGKDFFDLWYDLKSEEFLKMELSYCFHLMPPPDCDYDILFEEMIRKSKNTNSVDRDSFKSLIEQYNVDILVKTLVKYGKGCLGYIKCPDNMKLKEQEWVIACLNKKVTYPPKELWSKLKLGRFYERSKHSDEWNLKVKDATNVINDLEHYTKGRHKDTKWSKFNDNELLYALKYGKFIDFGIDPKSISLEHKRGVYSRTMIATLAAKSENAKRKDGMRETVSLCTEGRVFTSESEKSSIEVAAGLPSLSIRRNIDELEETINKMCKMSVPNKFRLIDDQIKRICLLMSSDVKGWSPNANREYCMMFHECTNSFIKDADGFKLKLLWENMVVILDKIGIRRHSKLLDSMVQGWTATQDTLLHCAILAFVTRKLCEAGIIGSTEQAYALCLIDDAIIAIELESERSTLSLQSTANKFHKKVIDTYAKVGFTIEDTKTIFSTNKFIFLNKFYCNGVEVNTSSKVISNLSINRTSLFPTSIDHTDALFSVAKAAVTRGASPALCYYMAVKRTIILIYSRFPKSRQLSQVKLWFLLHTPASIGGFSIPTFINFCGLHINDHLNHTLSAAFYMMSFATDNIVKKDYIDSISNIYDICYKSNKLRIITYKEARQPKTIANSKASSAFSSVVKSKIKLMDISNCQKLYMDFLEEDMPEVFSKAIKDSVIDISVLEEIMELLPTQVGENMLSKFYRSDTLTKLGNYFPSAYIRSNIRKEDVRAVNLFIEHLSYESNTEVPREKGLISPFAISYVIREIMLSNNSLFLTNHTLPDPFYLMNYDEDPKLSHMRVKCHDCINPITGETDLTHGLSLSGRKISKPIPCVKHGPNGSAWSSDDVGATYASNISLGNYVIKRKGDGNFLANLVNLSWGSNKHINVSDYIGICIEDVSTKHIGNSSSNSYHTIVPCPSTSSSVSIGADRLAKFVYSGDYHIDYMSIITAMCTRALVEYQLLSEHLPVTHYSLLSQDIIPSDKVAFKYLGEKLIKPSEVSKSTLEIWERTSESMKSINERSLMERPNMSMVATRDDEKVNDKSITRFQDYSILDYFKIKNLELTVTLRDKSTKEEEYSVITALYNNSCSLVCNISSKHDEFTLSLYPPWIVAVTAIAPIIKYDVILVDKVLAECESFCGISLLLKNDGYKVATEFLERMVIRGKLIECDEPKILENRKLDFEEENDFEFEPLVEYNQKLNQKRLSLKHLAPDRLPLISSKRCRKAFTLWTAGGKDNLIMNQKRMEDVEEKVISEEDILGEFYEDYMEVFTAGLSSPVIGFYRGR